MKERFSVLLKSRLHMALLVIFLSILASCGTSEEGLRDQISRATDAVMKQHAAALKEVTGIYSSSAEAVGLPNQLPFPTGYYREKRDIISWKIIDIRRDPVSMLKPYHSLCEYQYQAYRTESYGGTEAEAKKLATADNNFKAYQEPKVCVTKLNFDNKGRWDEEPPIKILEATYSEYYQNRDKFYEKLFPGIIIPKDLINYAP